jgi:hypothetical protein
MGVSRKGQLDVPQDLEEPFAADVLDVGGRDIGANSSGQNVHASDPRGDQREDIEDLLCSIPRRTTIGRLDPKCIDVVHAVRVSVKRGLDLFDLDVDNVRPGAKGGDGEGRVQVWNGFRYHVS